MTTDLTNCDREPIHIPGSIQPHGAMLVCDPDTARITHASATAAELIGRASEDLIGLGLDVVLGAAAAHDLRNAATRAGGSHVAGVMMNLELPGAPRPVDAAIHRHQGRLFVELEPTVAGAHDSQGALDVTQSLIRRIGLESDVGKIAASGAKLIRAMLGYDRVMVYQFLHNGAGRVIAEAKAAHLNSFMGQHFPAADIPFQARRLYLVNSIRMIGDVGYEPVPVLPALAPGEPPIDMSFAQLRSVSPIHCEYLNNMGVSASMSISIVVDGALWGLVSCHHDSPKLVPMPLRIGADLFGQYFSMQVTVAERRAEMMVTAQARERLDHIVADVQPGEPIGDAVTRHLDDLSKLIDCDGAALWVHGVWTSLGRVPARAHVERLMAQVQRRAAGSVWHVSDLRAILDDDPNYGGDVAGLLAIPVSSQSRDYLLLFRSEEAFAIEWAGEPVKTIVTGPSGDRLSPRGSFDTWREEVRGRSKPWLDGELVVAEAIRTYLRDVVLRFNEATADERDRAEQRRRVLNDELNHRVKNIIALVKSIALQTGAHASSVEDYSASLEGRLRALAFAHDQSLQGSAGGDLATLVEAEASLHRYGAAEARVLAEGPGVGLTDRAFSVVALMVHEMMTNAAKYGALSTPHGRLKIAWSQDGDGNCRIEWRETGGPAVSPPTRTGFGSKLIVSTVTYDLEGSVRTGYPVEGFRADIVIPAKHLTESGGLVPVEPVPETAAPSLDGLDVLIVEDQVLIAMDTEQTLRDLGAASVRSVPSVAGAIAELGRRAPDCAVLDYNLGDGSSAEFADRLVDLGIGFVFATGYGDSVMIPERFRQVPVVRKPVNRTTLAEQLASARDQRSVPVGDG